MKASVSIQGNVRMRLDSALLIYRSEQGRGSAYVTRHSVNNGSLGPVEPLSYEFVSDLSEALKQEIKLEILPSNVLARTNDIIVWWTPAQRRTMFFTSDQRDQANKFSGKTYAHPPLVWMLRREQLYVRAMIDSERPAADTKLFVAPYWNVSNTGLVCIGDMKRPDTRSVEGIATWEEGFFTSNFSHPNATKICDFPGGYLPMLAFINNERDFPRSFLVDAKQTLGQFVKERD